MPIQKVCTCLQVLMHLRRLATIFLALLWIFSNTQFAWKAFFDFRHTTPPFQPKLKLYVFVGFQAKAVTITTVRKALHLKKLRLSRNLIRHFATKLSGFRQLVGETRKKLQERFQVKGIGFFGLILVLATFFLLQSEEK